MAPPRVPLPPQTSIKQTIQARHGVATFVPQGYTIKIINTYGKQVVDTWAFALHGPPEDGDLDDREGEAPKAEDDQQNAEVAAAVAGVGADSERDNGREARPVSECGVVDDDVQDENLGVTSQKLEVPSKHTQGAIQIPRKPVPISKTLAEQAKGSTKDRAAETIEAAQEESLDLDTAGTKSDEAGKAKTEPREQDVGEGSNKIVRKKADAKVPDPKDDGKETTENRAEKFREHFDDEPGTSALKKNRWSDYLPSIQRSKSQLKKRQPKSLTETPAEIPDKVPEEPAKVSSEQTPPKPTPSGQGPAKGWAAYLPASLQAANLRASTAKEGASNNTNSQKKGWSSYIPSGQAFSSYIPSKDAISAFAGSHYRDPNKSYAEQLYDFSKTPVGAAGLSAASGSGYAGSLYAAYKAYEHSVESRDIPGMEYMSMMHSRASTLHLSPRVGDTLVSNLRAPLLTVIEDTSAGVHDTLIAACDPQRYKELGAERWEEHGSCAENCVLALKQINESSGLKGKKAIGADVTVNTVPAPLNLFMNIPWTKEGDVSFEAPKTKKGDYIRFRAERDVVIVMSACPQDILSINGHRPMVAHFVVEDGDKRDKEASEKKGLEAESILAKARRRLSGISTPRMAAGAASATSQTEGEEDSRPGAETPDVSKPEERGADQPGQIPSVDSKPASNIKSPPNIPRAGKKAPRKLEKRAPNANPSRSKALC